jgi:hypothetical protein
MIETTALTIPELESIARLQGDHDYRKLHDVLLRERSALLESMSQELDPLQITRLQGEAQAIKAALELPEASRKALVLRRQNAGS